MAVTDAANATKCPAVAAVAADATDDVHQRKWMAIPDLSQVIDLWNEIDGHPAADADSRNDLPQKRQPH